MDNNFLQNFIQMRAGLRREEPVVNHRSVKNGARPMPEPHGITLQTIIEDLPDKKTVLEYFRQRIKEFDEDD